MAAGAFSGISSSTSSFPAATLVATAKAFWSGKGRSAVYSSVSVTANAQASVLTEYVYVCVLCENESGVSGFVKCEQDEKRSKAAEERQESSFWGEMRGTSLRVQEYFQEPECASNTGKRTTKCCVR
jgi:S-formylglutathione hydrolase FrmB